jgi:uncharacterized protein with PhoU and TrkA domain
MDTNEIYKLVLRGIPWRNPILNFILRTGREILRCFQVEPTSRHTHFVLGFLSISEQFVLDEIN